MVQQVDSNNLKYQQLDKLFTTLSDEQKFNGNIMILEAGEVIYKGTFGYAELDKSKKLTYETVFELASVSKLFTALGIMILKEQGKLDYNDMVETILPELPYKGISIRNLLSHTSGLPDYMELFAQCWDRSKIATNQDVIEQLNIHKPAEHFKPNEKYEYSNTGYVLLAMIIEQVSGISFANFLNKYIFKPLDMESTRIFNRRFSLEVIDDYAYGYVYSEILGKYSLPDVLQEHDFVNYLDGIQGDGVVNSTLDDLRKLDRALYTEKLVSKATLKEAFSPVILSDNNTYDYGFGWQIRDNPETGKIVYHGGSWPGYRTWFSRYIDNDKTIIYLTNVEREREWTQTLIEVVENILFDRPYQIPE